MLVFFLKFILLLCVCVLYKCFITLLSGNTWCCALYSLCTVCYYMTINWCQLPALAWAPPFNPMYWLWEVFYTDICWEYVLGHIYMYFLFFSFFSVRRYIFFFYVLMSCHFFFIYLYHQHNNSPDKPCTVQSVAIPQLSRPTSLYGSVIISMMLYIIFMVLVCQGGFWGRFVCGINYVPYCF